MQCLFALPRGMQKIRNALIKGLKRPRLLEAQSPKPSRASAKKCNVILHECFV